MLNDPAQAIDESRRLDQSSEECQNIIGELEGIIDELPTYWEGVSANVFIQNNRQVIERLKRIKEEMHQISLEINTLATS